MYFCHYLPTPAQLFLLLAALTHAAGDTSVQNMKGAERSVGRTNAGSAVDAFEGVYREPRAIVRTELSRAAQNCVQHSLAVVSVGVASGEGCDGSHTNQRLREVLGGALVVPSTHDVIPLTALNVYVCFL